MRTLEVGRARFRAVRQDLEASVLPPATSLDGRRLTFQASPHNLEAAQGARVEEAATFGLGEALVAGKKCPSPAPAG